MAWKYIIVQVGNQEVPVVFPGRLVHRLMADSMRDYFIKVAVETVVSQMREAGADTVMLDDMAVRVASAVVDTFKVGSAGFVDVDFGRCHGSSETLQAKARDDDSERLRAAGR